MKNDKIAKYGYFPGIYLNEEKKFYYNRLLRKIFDGDYSIEQIDKCYCGSDALEILSVEDRFGLPFGTKICRSCGLISLSPRLSEDCLNDFYNEIYWGLMFGGSDDQELAAGGTGGGDHIFAFLKDYIDFSISEPIRIGEIGCGSGLKLAEIQRACYRRGRDAYCCGCDFSSEAVRLANEKGLFVTQGGSATLADEKLDIVILSHVVEHFPNLDRELGGIKSLMKHEGIVYVEVPGVCDLENKYEYSYSYNIYSVLAHMYNFNLSSLRYVMESNGFKFVKGNEYVKSLFQISTDDCPQVDVTGNYKNTMECLKRALKKQTQVESETGRLLKSFIKKIVKRIRRLIQRL